MTNKLQSPSLMDEYPLLVYPSLAEAMGINKAVVFQQLHFLLCNQKTAKNEYVFVNGRWWVYNSYKEWKVSYFNWLTTVTLQRLFTALEQDKLVLTMQSVKNKSDRRKWYTIDYKQWESYQSTIVSKRYDEPSYQNDMVVGSKRYDGYSDTSSETPKGEDSPSKKKTQRQILIAQLQPHIKLANTILALIESGYVDGMNTPDTYMTIPHLEKYLPNLEELARMEATPEELKCLYSHFEPIYTSNKWSIGVKTFVEKLQAYRSMNGNSPSKKKEQSESPAHRLFNQQVPPPPAKLSAAEIAAIKAKHGVKTS